MVTVQGDRQSPLEDMLRRIMLDKEDNDALHLRERYVDICDMLIDGLVDASDLPGFVRLLVSTVLCSDTKLPQTVIDCIRMIHLFAAAYPQILSASKASTLLPYLKNSSSVPLPSGFGNNVLTVESISPRNMTSDYLLKIFRTSIPHTLKPVAAFGQELQLALQLMIQVNMAELVGEYRWICRFRASLKMRILYR